jgi:glycosyltransferase involved in cell wall biosynthesis
MISKVVFLGPFNPQKVLPSFQGGNFPVSHGAYPFEQFVLEMKKIYPEVFVISLSQLVEEVTTYQFENLKVYLVPQRKRARQFAIDFYKLEIKHLIYLIEQIDPNVINAHWTYEYAMAAAKSKRPHLITVHDYPPIIFKFYRNFYRLILLIMSLQLRFRTQDFVYVSNYLKNKWTSGYFLRYEQPVISNFSSLTFENSIHNKNGQVICIGNSSRLKNVKKLLKAWQLVEKQNQNLKLVLIGPGLGKNDKLHQWALKRINAHNIEWCGALNRDDLVQMLRNSTILVHPSHEESQGLVLIEAMAVGVPTISGIKSGGNVETVGDAGILIDITDKYEISKAILDLSENIELRIQLIAKGIERHKNFFRPIVILGKYKELFEKQIKKVK